MLESEKKELLLSINAFNRPTELQGKEAWVQLILNLLNMEKGSYPSMPNMGVGLQNYEYAYIDEVIQTLKREMDEQIRQYITGIPLENINLSTTEVNGKTVLIILITLTVPGGGSDTAVIASSQNASTNIIDFAIQL